MGEEGQGVHSERRFVVVWSLAFESIYDTPKCCNLSRNSVEVLSFIRGHDDAIGNWQRCWAWGRKNHFAVQCQGSLSPPTILYLAFDKRGFCRGHRHSTVIISQMITR